MKNNKKPVIAYLHTHWDAEWYKTFDAFNVRLYETVNGILDELKKNNRLSFYFDGQIYAFLNYLEFAPEKKNLIKNLIKEKKLFIGPFFVSADSFLSSAGVLIKNLELGIKFSKKFGEDNFIGYLSDTFGHSKSIFEILKLFNIDKSIIWRGTKALPADFTANGIKTTRLVYGYYQDILHSDFEIEKKALILEKILDKINEFSNDVLLLPLGADHMGIIKNAPDKIKEINKYLKNYEIKLSNPFEYFKKADYKKANYEGEFLDNSLTYILQGVYSSRADEKAKNAYLQWELFNKVYVFDYFMKNKFKPVLENAAIELIKNHAHDSIYGCSTDEVHKTIRTRQLKVNETVNAVTKSLIRDFKDKYLIDYKENMLGVFNFSNKKQNNVVKFITDKKIKNAQKINEFISVDDDISYNLYKNPMTENFHKFYEYIAEISDIKPFSFKNVEIKPPEIKHALGDDFIENDFIKLFILNNQIYCLNKKENQLYENFMELHSTKDSGDSYNYAPAGYPETLKIKKTKIKLKGKIKSTLQVTFEENIKLNVSIYNNLEFLDFEIDFINKKKNRKLQISFNLKNPVKKTIANDTLGLIERTHDFNYLLYEHIPVKDKSELKTNCYPMQKFVHAQNLSIYTKGLNEYEIYKNSVKISILRSTGIISNKNNPARKIPAGPPILCPDMQGIGQHKFNFAISFENNPDDSFIKAVEFYNPLIAISGEYKIKEKIFIKNPFEDREFIGIFNNKPLYYKDKLYYGS